MALQNRDRGRGRGSFRGITAGLAGLALAGTVAATGCTAPQNVVDAVFGPAGSQAQRIVQCESGFRANAVSPTNDHGLFQINIVHRTNFTTVTGQPWAKVYDPFYNTMYAKWLYDRQGWQPWTCKRVLGL